MSFECCSFSDLHYQGDQTLSITTYSSTSVVSWIVFDLTLSSSEIVDDNGEGETVVIRPSPNNVEDMITRPPKE
ncbi:unnamed protein product [Brassica oleracea var. botrytis]|uniref:Uncharacterized protein n=1 Tax=Brassica oleracea TaxID=3712 RepID=A0A3P6FD13_BRAOL|nr:unnamed protein product [Brassica oleracea]VDD25925.1 unnamed protein product [Brassica oleracea]VDD50718.1 unnamed protein product [Brassica oleracea]